MHSMSVWKRLNGSKLQSETNLLALVMLMRKQGSGDVYGRQMSHVYLLLNEASMNGNEANYFQLRTRVCQSRDCDLMAKWSALMWWLCFPLAQIGKSRKVLQIVC